MTTYEGEFAVANHWPLIERSILWRQASAHKRVLAILAREQSNHFGAPVRLGVKHFVEVEEMTENEAISAARALKNLSHLGIVTCSIGGGPVASTWSFSKDVTRWRGKVWASSQASVGALIFGCRSATVLATAQQFPDQKPFQRNTSSKSNDCAESNHVISRDFLREMFLFRDRCIARDLFPSGNLVELFSSGESKNSSYHSFCSSKEELSLEDEREEKLLPLQAAIAKRATNGGTAHGKTKDALIKLVDGWTLEQCHDMAAMLCRITAQEGRKDQPYIIVMEQLPKLARSPEFRMSAGVA